MVPQWTKRENCLICQSKRLKVVRKEKNLKAGRLPLDLFLEGTSELVECEDCKMAFVQTLPQNPEFFSLLYSDEGRDISIDFQFTGKEKIFQELLGILTKHKTTGSLLDIGAGTGIWIKHASTYFKCTGIEIGPSASSYGRQQGLNILTQSDFGESLPSESYDIVTLIDVLEHLPDPKFVLDNALRLLKREGVILIKVPNYRAQALKQDLLNKFHISDFGIMQNFIHINHFTPKSLRTALERTGFQVLDIQPTMPELWNWRIPGTPRQKFIRGLRNAAVLAITGLVNKTAGPQGGFNFSILAKKSS